MKIKWDRPTLIKLLTDHGNQEKAPAMAAYMKNHFPFLGIQSPLRADLLKQYFSIHELPEGVQGVWEEVFALLDLTEREFHYAAIALMGKMKLTIEDLDRIQRVIETKSWWDSVDSIAPTILGNVVKKERTGGEEVMKRWAQSENMWVVRASILHQLKYKAETNEALLFDTIERQKESDEFFIQKAIGWSLREYAKTSPNSVRTFVETTDLKPLSRREALKHIK